MRDANFFPLYTYAVFPVFAYTECTVLLAPPATELTLINVHPARTWLNKERVARVRVCV